MEQQMETLYRFFDEQDNLLYVGISNSWQNRLRQHYKNSSFFEEASLITLEHYEDRSSVELAEKIAISNENPKYNKAFNPNFENAQKHIIRLGQMTYGQIEIDDSHALMIDFLRWVFQVDDLWVRKSNGPVAHYFYYYLANYAKEHAHHCEYCVNAFHSDVINAWSADYRRKLYATR